jgi:hypothetical protein
MNGINRPLPLKGRRSAMFILWDPRTIQVTLFLAYMSATPLKTVSCDDSVLKYPGDGLRESHGRALGDEITSLPGFTGELRSKHYSGNYKARRVVRFIKGFLIPLFR